MLCIYSRIKSESWLKSVLPLLKYEGFSRGLFFIGAPHPVHLVVKFHQPTRTLAYVAYNFD